MRVESIEYRFPADDVTVCVQHSEDWVVNVYVNDADYGVLVAPRLNPDASKRVAMERELGLIARLVELIRQRVPSYNLDDYHDTFMDTIPWLL